MNRVQAIINKAEECKKLEVTLTNLRNIQTKKWLSIEEKNILDIEIRKLEAELKIDRNIFSFTKDEIENAAPILYLVDYVVPASTILVFIGQSGSGKTTIVRHLIYNILCCCSDAYVVYIDGDNTISNLKKFGIHTLMEQFGERLQYYGKLVDNCNFSDMAQNVIIDTTWKQEQYPKRKYIIVEDNLKNIAKKDLRGFIDTKLLYHNERLFRAAGGTSLILHHTNKQGVFADSQDIINFCDASYLVKFNTSSSAILLEAHKQSRYNIANKAYSVDVNRTILNEIDYHQAMISDSEMKIISLVKEILGDVSSMNQGELEKETKNIRAFLNLGDKRFRLLLKKYANKEWLEKRNTNNNTLFYCQIAKVPNGDKK